MKQLIARALWCSLVLYATATKTSVIDTATQQDLDLTGKQGNLAGVIPTKTLAGKKALEEFFLYPTDAQHLLIQRQKILLWLQQHDLYNTLQEKLAILAAYEADLVPEKEQLSRQALEKVYFSKRFEKYNISPYALDAACAARMSLLCLPAIEYALLHMGFNWYARSKKDVAEQLGHHHHHHSAHSACCGAQIRDDAGNLAFLSFHALILAMHISPLITMVEDLKQQGLMIKLLQQKMIAVAAYVKTAQEIFELLQQYHADDCNMSAFNTLEHFFGEQPSCSAHAQQLLALLQQSTFTGKASMINHVGNVLAAYKLYTNLYEEFTTITDALAELDIFLGAASMIKNQTPDAPWCFVEYKKSKLPLINAHALRHLFIPAAQSHHWNFSSQDALHTFITGDNGSGKSTYINGLGHALILAQTWGIAPAQQFQMTPFSCIMTYRFIQDNIAQGTSRFYAECGRIETILQAVDDTSGLSCVLLDEPFTSTYAEKGSDFLEAALSRLYQTTSVISLTASHYTHLRTLAKEHKKTRHLHVTAAA